MEEAYGRRLDERIGAGGKVSRRRIGEVGIGGGEERRQKMGRREDGAKGRWGEGKRDEGN